MKFRAIVASLLLAASFIVFSMTQMARATSARPDGLNDQVFYNAGTETIYAVATSGRGFYVRPGHMSTEFAQTTGSIPANTYGGLPACYHAWIDSHAGYYNVYGRSINMTIRGTTVYVTAYGKTSCP